MEIGVMVLPKLPKDAGDRNRTSPFAFTGNKFEFRAVGSSQSIGGPNTVLNTVVAESLDYMATSLENAIKAGKSLPTAIQELLPGIIKESKKVLFNGNGYSDEWHAEAAKRGLPNLKNSVDSLPVVIRKDSVALFEKYKVYTEGELKSRYNILCENYVKTVMIEGKLTKFIGQQQILPACLRYQAEVANSINAAKSAGADVSGQMGLLQDLSKGIADLQALLSKLGSALEHHASGDLLDHAKHCRDHVLHAMAGVREKADALEVIVADDLWPIPTYREMLFIR
jgi:glutamine synthetase